MNYKDYKTASERHLETCLKLKDVVASQYLGKTLLPIEIKKQDEILANIYYLSGYIIECIVSYGILKYLKFDKIVEKENNILKKINPIKYKEYDFSCHELLTKHNTERVTFSQNKEPNAKYHLYKNSHKLYDADKTNLFFFKNIGIQDIKIDEIMNSWNNNKDVKILFSKWSVDTRYAVNPAIQKNDQLINCSAIFNFLDFAQLVNFNLTNHIIPKI